MDPRAARLFSMLERIAVTYGDLSEVLQAEAACMAMLNMKQLAEVTQTKEALLAKICDLEQERILTTQVLAEDLGVNPTELTLLKISELLGLNGGAKFKAAHEALKLLLENTRSLNKENMEIAQSSLERIEEMKRNILGVTNRLQEGYNAQGGVHQNSNQGGRLLSQKA